jgi:3-isopropylmalate/(R)-2-methylmalate dehydratase small subunit
MTPFTRLKSVGAAIAQANLDTDQIIPARFLQEPRLPGRGYSPFLFHDLRRLPNGSLDDDFALNHSRNASARILVSRRNFGSGSSREAAVYALVDSGVRCVIAPSHGDIFASNAVNNGLLPARLNESAVEIVLELLAPGGVEIEVDLEAQIISLGTGTFEFQIDPVWRVRLLNGWDDLNMTLRFSDRINVWQTADRQRRPWAQVRAVDEPA